MALDNVCPGAKRFLEPSPEEFRCRSCGAVVEIWSDEAETTCRGCGAVVRRPAEKTCLDWCSSAEQCLGVMKYNKLLRQGLIHPGGADDEERAPGAEDPDAAG